MVSQPTEVLMVSLTGVLMASLTGVLMVSLIAVLMVSPLEVHMVRRATKPSLIPATSNQMQLKLLSTRTTLQPTTTTMPTIHIKFHLHHPGLLIKVVPNLTSVDTSITKDDSLLFIYYFLDLFY